MMCYAISANDGELLLMDCSSFSFSARDVEC